jgi:hypothetical protein
MVLKVWGTGGGWKAFLKQPPGAVGEVSQLCNLCRTRLAVFQTAARLHVYGVRQSQVRYWYW